MSFILINIYEVEVTI